MIFGKPRHVQGSLNCIQVGRVLQEYLDDVVDETTAERVTAHLDECKRCGLSAAEYRKIKKSLASVGAETAADPAVGRLKAFAARIGAGEIEVGVNPDDGNLDR